MKSVCCMGVLLLVFSAPLLFVAEVHSQEDQIPDSSPSDAVEKAISFELRNELLSLVSESRPLLTKDQFEIWSDRSRVSNMTSSEALEVANAVSGKIYTLANQPIPVIANRLSRLTKLYFGLGDFKQGLRQLDRLQIAFVTAPNQVVVPTYRRIGRYLFDAVYGQDKHDVDAETLDRLANKLKSIVKLLPANTNDEILSTELIAGYFYGALFRLKQYESAASICKTLHQNPIVQAGKNVWDKKNNLGALYRHLLWQEIQCQLALGNRKQVEELFVKLLKHRLLSRKKWWKAIGLDRPDEFVPGFEDVWHLCTRLGYGPVYPEAARFPKKMQTGVGFFQAGKCYFATPVPSSELTIKGRELRKQMKGHVYFKSEKIEDAIKAFCDEPAFQEFDTIVLLRFLLLEYQLVNGHGKQAAETLQRLQKTWEQFESEPISTDSRKKLLDLFAVRQFRFDEYTKYLCTYFDCAEFRKLFKYRRPWKGHRFYFGYDRPVPDHASAKPTPAKPAGK